MAQAQVNDAEVSAPDLLDLLATIQPGSTLAETRARRADVARYTQGSYNALLTPTDPAGVSLVEREMVALRAAILTASPGLIEHYRGLLQQRSVSAETITAVEHFPAANTLSAREAAILRHVDQLTNEPRAATAEQLAELQTHGLSARDIVSIAQLIAFLSYQVRLLAGLQLLAEAA